MNLTFHYLKTSSGHYIGIFQEIAAVADGLSIPTMKHYAFKHAVERHGKAVQIIWEEHTEETFCNLFKNKELSHA
jgi:hypothetical protein